MGARRWAVTLARWAFGVSLGVLLCVGVPVSADPHAEVECPHSVPTERSACVAPTHAAACTYSTAGVTTICTCRPDRTWHCDTLP